MKKKLLNAVRDVFQNKIASLFCVLSLVLLVSVALLTYADNQNELTYELAKPVNFTPRLKAQILAEKMKSQGATSQSSAKLGKVTVEKKTDGK